MCIGYGASSKCARHDTVSAYATSHNMRWHGGNWVSNAHRSTLCQSTLLPESLRISVIPSIWIMDSFNNWVTGDSTWLDMQRQLRWLIANWILSQFSRIRMRKATRRCSLKDDNGVSHGKSEGIWQGFGNWMHDNNNDPFDWWWIPTMTPKTNDQQRQHILVFISAYIAIKLSLANMDRIPLDSMLIISQHSTSIHSSLFIMSITTPPAMLHIYFGCISASGFLMSFNMVSSQQFTAIWRDHWTLAWWGSLLSFHLAIVLWMALYTAAHWMTWLCEIIFEDVSHWQR